MFCQNGVRPDHVVGISCLSRQIFVRHVSNIKLPNFRGADWINLIVVDAHTGLVVFSHAQVKDYSGFAGLIHHLDKFMGKRS